MIIILQETFSNTFYQLKFVVFCLKFHQNLFPMVQSTNASIVAHQMENLGCN